MSLNELVVGSAVAHFASSARGTKVAKRQVARVTATLIVLDGAGQRFSKRTGHQVGGPRFYGGWIEAWQTKHENLAAERAREEAVEGRRRALSAFRWKELTAGEIERVETWLKAEGLWERGSSG